MLQLLLHHSKAGYYLQYLKDGRQKNNHETTFLLLTSQGTPETNLELNKLANIYFIRVHDITN